MKKFISFFTSSLILLSYSTNAFSEENKSEDSETKITKTNSLNTHTRKKMGNNVSLGGYFDTEYYIPQTGNTFFDQHRLVLQASSLYNDRLFFNTEVEFEHGGISDENKGEINIEQAFLDYKIEDWLNFRGGVILQPLGRLNTFHDSDIRETTARPLFNRLIIPTTWSDTGLGFFGTISPNDSFDINYDLYLTQGLNGNITEENGLKESKPTVANDNNNNKAVSGRIGISPFIGLDMGVSGYFGAYDDKSQKNLGILAGDFKYTLGSFDILGEAGYVNFDPVELKDKDGKVTGILKSPMLGYFIESRYRFFPEFLKLGFLGKDFDHPAFTIFGRIDQVDTNTSILNENDLTQLCFGFNYRPITNVAFKFEYQINLNNEAIIKNDWSKQKQTNQFIASLAAGF